MALFKKSSLPPKIIKVDGIYLHRDGVKIRFNIPVKYVFHPIPGTIVNGCVLNVRFIWNWQEFLRLASKQFLIAYKGCEYELYLPEKMEMSSGYNNMNAVRNYKKLSLEKKGTIKPKNDRLDSIPEYVDVSLPAYLKTHGPLAFDV